MTKKNSATYKKPTTIELVESMRQQMNSFMAEFSARDRNDTAKTLSYVDSQRVAALHNRMNKIDDKMIVDRDDLTRNRQSIVSLESKVASHSDYIGRMKSMTFLQRLAWLFVGGK